jgi:hypothetical protein
MLLPHSFSCGKTKITADKAFVSVEWEVNVRLKCSAARNMGFGGWGSDYCGIPSTLTAAPSPTPTPTTSRPAPPVNSGTVYQWIHCCGEGWGAELFAWLRLFALMVGLGG